MTATRTEKARLKITAAEKQGTKKSVPKPKPAGSAAQLIDGRIAELGDWRGEMLARIRKVIHEADPDVIETWKWRGTPVWEHAGILCTGETYKEVVKMTFHKGASLPDPAKLFNSSLEGNTRRAIDIRQGEKLNEKALQALIRAAVALNVSKSPTRPALAKKLPNKPAKKSAPKLKQ